MFRAFVFLCLSLLLTACGRPSYNDYAREDTPLLHAFMTGNLQTARDALLAQEKLLEKHESLGNRGIDYLGARQVLYGNLCGLCVHLGNTNEAKSYFRKYVANSPNKNISFDELIAAAEKHHRRINPKWMQDLPSPNPP